ncbi:membrane protein containing DUF1112, partial [mine drainage metagenome]
AILLTFAVMAVMWFLYQSGLIRVTKQTPDGDHGCNRRRVSVLPRDLDRRVFWRLDREPVFREPDQYRDQPGHCCIAAFNLLLDFDLIARGAQSGWPHYMEWYSAFALTVTLVWLYLELLTLLANLNSR